MALGETLKPAGDVLSISPKGAGIFFIVLIVGAIIGGALYFISLRKKQKKQWTHKLIGRRELPNGELSKKFVHKMARFPKVKGANLFQLEKPFLGSWLFPEIQEYSNHNEFEVIIGKDNNIYYKTGEKFDKENGNLKISGKHAQIDLAMKNIKDNWHKEHQELKKISTADLIKAGLKVILIVGAVIAIKFMSGAYIEAKQVEANALDKWVNVSENFIKVTEIQQETNLLYKEDNALMKREFCKENPTYSFCRTL